MAPALPPAITAAVRKYPNSVLLGAGGFIIAAKTSKFSFELMNQATPTVMGTFSPNPEKYFSYQRHSKRTMRPLSKAIEKKTSFRRMMNNPKNC